MTALRSLVIGLTVLAIASCTPVAKQEAVERIADAAQFDDVRAGTITVSTTGSNQQLAVPGLAPAPTAAAAALRFVVDRTGSRRAVLLAPPTAAATIGPAPGGGFPALVIFDGTRIYVRAVDAGLVGARPWLATDIERLGAVAEATTEDLAAPRTAGDLVVLSPIDLLDLALGFLTGSVREDESSYRGRTSLDKEFHERRLDPSDADPILDLLRTFAADDDIHPIEVDLDEVGALRRLAVSFVGKPEYGVRFSTTYDLLFEEGDAPVDRSVLEVPDPADVVELDSIGDLQAAVDQWTLVEAPA